MNRKILRLTAAVAVFALAGCFHDDDDDSATTGGGTGTTVGLTAADEPNVTPCPDQAILTDATELASLKTALGQGAILYLDVPFDANDPNIFKKKCGLEGFWDPADNVDEIAPATLGLDPANITLADLFESGNAGICADGFTFTSFGTGEGFPTAGVYRKEIKVTHMGSTYHLRFRVTTSGTSAGNTFVSENIDINDIRSNLTYKIDGTTIVHANLFDEAINALSASSNAVPSFTLTVHETGAGPAVFTADVEVICVSKS